MFYVLNIILPVVLLSMLNVFVFLPPTESGEKISYAMTVFLAFAVFLTIISSTLPRNSESISVLGAYLIYQSLQSTLILLLTAFQQRLYHRDDVQHPVVGWVQTCVRFTAVISCEAGCGISFKKMRRTLKELSHKCRKKRPDQVQPEFMSKLPMASANLAIHLLRPPPMRRVASRQQLTNDRCSGITAYPVGKRASGSGQRISHQPDPKIMSDVDNTSNQYIGWKEVVQSLDFVLFWFFLTLDCLTITAMMAIAKGRLPFANLIQPQ
jgi:hypothetical protein